MMSHHICLRRLTGLLLIVLCAAVSGCERDEPRTLIDLVDHFRKAGIQGRYRRLKPDRIRAKEAGRFAGEGFAVQFAKFDDPRQAEQLAKTGYRGYPCYAHGRFLMLVERRETNVKLLRTFLSF